MSSSPSSSMHTLKKRWVLDGHDLSIEALQEHLTEYLQKLKKKNEGNDPEQQQDNDEDDDGSCTTSSSSPSSFYDVLELRHIDFDPHQSALIIEVIRSQPCWKRVSIIQCSGLVNDVLLACTSHVHIKDVQLHQPIINSQTTYALVFGLKYNTQLRTLHLSLMTQVWSDVSVASSLSKALARNTTLVELSLEKCDARGNGSGGGTGGGDIDTDDHVDPTVTNAVRHLSFGLRLNQTLHVVNLNGCGLADSHCATLLGALQGHSSLRKLHLQQNACHTEGMTAVAGLLHDNTALKELDLSFLIRPKAKKKKSTIDDETKDEMTADSEGGKEEVEKKDGDAREGDAQKSSDEDAGVEKDKDDDDGTKHDTNNDKSATDEDDQDKGGGGEQKVTNTTLQILKLAGNGLGDDFIESLLDIFVRGSDSSAKNNQSSSSSSSCSQLQELNLFGNRMSNRGLKHMLRRLSKLPNLHRLYLQHNSLLRPVQLKTELLSFMQGNYNLHEFAMHSPLFLTTTTTNTMGAAEVDAEAQQQQLQNDGHALQDKLDYYGRLNRTGRRIMASFAASGRDCNSDSDDVMTTSSTNNADNSAATAVVPLGLWPLIFERANRMAGDTVSHAADVMDCLLQQGPVVLDNPHLT